MESSRHCVRRRCGTADVVVTLRVFVCARVWGSEECHACARACVRVCVSVRDTLFWRCGAAKVPLVGGRPHAPDWMIEEGTPVLNHPVYSFWRPLDVRARVRACARARALEQLHGC